MIALMALWFGRHAGVPSDGGYFYLCPACYHECIDPHLDAVLQTLLDQHPFLHRILTDREIREFRERRETGRPGNGSENGPANGSGLTGSGGADPVTAV